MHFRGEPYVDPVFHTFVQKQTGERHLLMWYDGSPESVAAVSQKCGKSAYVDDKGVLIAHATNGIVQVRRDRFIVNIDGSLHAIDTNSVVNNYYPDGLEAEAFMWRFYWRVKLRQKIITPKPVPIGWQ